MQELRRRYLLKETSISVAISAAISALFVWLIFGGSSQVSLWGAGGLAFDFLPQTFMVGLMSVVAPTLITRKRALRGRLGASGRSFPLPRNLALRALLFAGVACLILSPVALAFTSLVFGDNMAFAVVLPLKVAYGALVAAIVTPLAVGAALDEKAHSHE